VCVCVIFFFCALYTLKKIQKIRLWILWWSNVTTKIHALLFYCYVSFYFRF